MMRVGLLPLLAAAACTPADQDAVARETAKAVVVPIVEARYPGVPAGPVATCIIDNATAPEILTLAGAAVTGVTPQTTQTTLTILARPGTVECVTEVGLTQIRGGAL